MRRSGSSRMNRGRGWTGERPSNGYVARPGNSRGDYGSASSSGSRGTRGNGAARGGQRGGQGNTARKSVARDAEKDAERDQKLFKDRFGRGKDSVARYRRPERRNILREDASFWFLFFSALKGFILMLFGGDYSAAAEEESLVSYGERSADKDKRYVGVTAEAQTAAVCNRSSSYRNRFRKEFAEFNQQIWRYDCRFSQDWQLYSKKASLHRRLIGIANIAFAGQKSWLYQVGSSNNGCGAKDGDLDMCLIIFDADGTLKQTEQAFKIENLRHFFEHIRSSRLKLTECAFIDTSTVPIITLRCEGVCIDISCNCDSGFLGSHLIYHYTRLDDRFPALCLVIKKWAQLEHINDARTGTLSSFSINMLVVHFLQCGVQPPVLPNLQFLFPKKFSGQNPLLDIRFWSSAPSPTFPLNRQSIGELLVGFFDYFASFDFSLCAPRIRMGDVISRSELRQQTERYGMYIEDPFGRGNTARCVQDTADLHRIQAAIKKAHLALSGNSSPSLCQLGFKLSDVKY